MSHSTKLSLSKQVQESLVEEIVDIIATLMDRFSVIYETETDAHNAIERLQRLEHAIRTGEYRQEPEGDPEETL